MDLTAYLSIATAIEVMGGLLPGGWPELMAANHELALAGQARLSSALGIPPPAPPEMVGAMAALPIPGAQLDDRAAHALERALATADHIEIPIPPWPVPAARRAPGDPPERVLLRISAQRFNDPGDFEALAAALARRGLAQG